LAGRHADAARIDAAAMAYVRRAGGTLHRMQELGRERMHRAFEAASVAASDIERWRREGEALDEAGVAALCLAQATA
jgi:hypothetical protein